MEIRAGPEKDDPDTPSVARLLMNTIPIRNTIRKTRLITKT
jgi:hypothetical protein